MAQDKGNPSKPPVPSRTNKPIHSIRTVQTGNLNSSNTSVDSSSISISSARQAFEQSSKKSEKPVVKPENKPAPQKVENKATPPESTTIVDKRTRAATSPAKTMPKPDASNNNNSHHLNLGPSVSNYPTIRSFSSGNIPTKKVKDKIQEVRESQGGQVLIRDLTTTYQEATKKHDETIQQMQIATQQMIRENEVKEKMFQALNDIHQKITQEKEELKILKSEAEERIAEADTHQAEHFCSLLVQGILVKELSTNSYLVKTNANGLNKDGQTVLHVATVRSDLESVRALLEKAKANPNIPNSDDLGKRLPLHLAFLEGAFSLDIPRVNEKLVELLLQHSNASIKDNKGKTPEDYLRTPANHAPRQDKEKHERILTLFKQHHEDMKIVSNKAQTFVQSQCDLMEKNQKDHLEGTAQMQLPFDEHLKYQIIDQNKNTVSKTLAELDKRLHPDHKKEFKKTLQQCERRLALALDEDKRFPKKEEVRFYDKQQPQISDNNNNLKNKEKKSNSLKDKFNKFFKDKPASDSAIPSVKPIEKDSNLGCN